MWTGASESGSKAGPPSGTGTNCFSSSATARSSSSPFLNGLPCQPSFPSTNETPLPLMVRARIIVGCRLILRASSSASRIAVRSWPSMTIACQPNARQRRSNCSMSCCHIVGRLWPSPLTSVRPQRLSSRSIDATLAASHTDPSADSPSPSNTYVRYADWIRLAFSAVPTAAQIPWPSDPVATSMNGSRGVGCPSRSESSRRSFRRSARWKAPASAHAA